MANLIKDTTALHSALQFNMEKKLKYIISMEFSKSFPKLWDTLAIYRKWQHFRWLPFLPQMAHTRKWNFWNTRILIEQQASQLHIGC